jgi:exodeoxyribonuclease VII small subunit
MASPSPAAPASFESALAELEGLIVKMEDGQLSLVDSLAAYKRGSELLQYCQATLKDAQQQVQILENGVLRPFTAEADDADERTR